MMQIAGVGLLVEVVAHELARSTENALAALEALHGRDVPEQIAGLFKALRSEMSSVSKRLRVLDPLSVSGRQRKELFNPATLIDDVLSGHDLQFDRHDVQLKAMMPEHVIRIRAVKSMVVQILENLVSNSLYWLDLRKQHEPGFQPRITISMEDNPLTITFEDNGRGIAEGKSRESLPCILFLEREVQAPRSRPVHRARLCRVPWRKPGTRWTHRP